MTSLILVRHAQNDWVKTGRLAGWTQGVHLNDEGRKQAKLLGQRLAGAKLQAVYSSPLERAVETAEEIVSHYPGLTIQIDKEVGEVDFGNWTGKRLLQLSRTRLWGLVQHYPSGARFPNGESIHEMQTRIVGAINRIADKYNGAVAVVSHSDVLKAAVTYYAGMPLDMFQRINISTASITVVTLHRGRPFIVKVNDTSHYEYPTTSEQDSPSTI